MDVGAAQAEVREVFRGGFYGQMVSGALWLAAAAVGTWGSSRGAGILLFAGGLAIFPLTVLLLRLEGGRAALSRGNPLEGLARQIAFTVPVAFPLAGAAALHRPHWFFPAAMVIVGAHYLPFEFLYGMRLFRLLGTLLAAGGILLGLYGPPVFALGGWIGGALLLVFGIAGRTAARTAETAGERAA